MKIKILAVLLALLLLTACSAHTEPTTAPNASQDASQTESKQEGSRGEESELASEGTDAEGSDVPNSQGETTGDASSTEGSSSQGQTSDPSTGETATTQTTEKIYEYYLSALTLYALTNEYPDFQLESIYAASIVPMEQKEQSKGIYVVFDSLGSKMVAYVSYIPAGRTEPGTCDVYSPDVGYAAFEIVDSVPENLTQLQMEDFSEALSEVSLPTMYLR